MVPGGRPPASTPPQGTIALRLALAFLAVALAAVAVAAGLTAAFAAADVSGLASRQRTELTTAIAVAAGAAWDRSGRWVGRGPVPGAGPGRADRNRRRRSATRPGSRSPRLPVSPGTRRALSSPSPSWCTAPRVGQVVARFTGGGLGATAAALKTALLRAIAGAAGLAALLALVTGLGVARWLTRPVVRLIAVTRAMARGDRGAGPARSAAAAS